MTRASEYTNYNKHEKCNLTTANNLSAHKKESTLIVLETNKNFCVNIEDDWLIFYECEIWLLGINKSLF